MSSRNASPGPPLRSAALPPSPPSPASSARSLSAPAIAPPPSTKTSLTRSNTDGDFLCLLAAGPLQLGSRIPCRFSRRNVSSTTFAVFIVLLFIALNLANSISLPALPAALNSRRSSLSAENALRTYFAAPEATVTVLLDRRTYDFPFSAFLAGTVDRFGSGRFTYRIRRFDSPLLDKDKNKFAADISPPCLVTSAKLAGAQAWRDAFAPHCLFMLTSDEFCDGAASPGIAVRQYDGASMAFKEKMKNVLAPVYLPLGPRLDFWAAFEEAQRADLFAIPKSSNRSLVFNAMFSKSTSESRIELSDILDNSNGTKFGTRALIRIADQWSSKLSNDHVGPAQYTTTLLDSVFTLSPTGHHPECYRMFEAMEAGSIPIMALDDDYRQHKCTDSLRRMRKSGAPMVLLATWRELPAKLDQLMADPDALDKRQADMALWYDDFMRENTRRFESVFVPKPNSTATTDTTDTIRPR